ncbi:hypothetical protein [Streptomyces cinereoruber]
MAVTRGRPNGNGSPNASVNRSAAHHADTTPGSAARIPSASAA